MHFCRQLAVVTNRERFVSFGYLPLVSVINMTNTMSMPNVHAASV